MKKVLHFLQYHNAVPLAVGIMIVGSGAAFAATNPQEIYNEQHTVLSVDNTYIANKNLEDYTPKTLITGVTEDDENYYVAYTFSTIDVRDYVWQDISRNETITVSKADLGPYRDLGVYITAQLKQIIGRESARLAATQEDARKQISQKVVATAYGGLVGKFLDETTETLPGYTPVVELPPAPEPQLAASAEAASGSASSATPNQSYQTVSSGNGPTIQILGNNPAQIPVGARYADLGAVVTSGGSDGLDITTFLNGRQVAAIDIDTSAPGQWRVRYEAGSGSAKSMLERIVMVYDPAVGPSVAAPQHYSAPAPKQETSSNQEPVSPTSETHATTTPPTTVSDTASTIAQTQQENTELSDTPTSSASTTSETATSTTP